MSAGSCRQCDPRHRPPSLLGCKHAQDQVSVAVRRGRLGDAPSRSTEVMTMYPTPHREIASAVFSGSCTSRGGGARDVLMAQNRHPRVHVSPMSCESERNRLYQHARPTCEQRSRELPGRTMMVAVASPLSPPQHCPMLGQRASSHTVCNLSPRRSCLILL